MNKYNMPIVKAYEKVLTLVSDTKWTGLKGMLTGGPGYDLLPEDHAKIKDLLSKDYYIILTRRKTHLTTYVIGLASLIKTGKFSYWSHALMNMEGDNPTINEDFKLMESTAIGVGYNTFMDVFDCDSVALLKPKFINLSAFTKQLDSMLISENGKPYDDLFDLADDTHLSCVELVRDALSALPDYHTKFASFETMIAKEGNLTPQMFYDSDCFEVVFEVRR
jgi:hypothetical protein